MNAEYIAAAATLLPSLVTELLELRRSEREADGSDSNDGSKQY